MKNPLSRKKEPKPPAGEMTLLAHLTELRTRLIRSVLAVVVGAIVVYIFRKPVFGVLEAPYCDFQAQQGVEKCQFQILAPLETFQVVLTLCGYGGLLLALPVVLYQLGRFIMPGLYPHEKRALIPFIVVSVLLLVGGMTAGFLLTPKALDVLLNFGPDSFVPEFRPAEYMGFFTKMLLAFGIAAELPLVLVFLQMIGVVKPDTLRGNRRIAVVAIVILGAIVTPTGDPFTLTVISVPMYLFFEISIIIGSRLAKRNDRVVAAA